MSNPDIDELDSILQSIGVSPADLTPNPQPTPTVEPIKVTISAGPGPAVSSGPGAVRSAGPGAMYSGPGNAVMSSGPGVTYSSGPGNVVMSSGPGVTYSSGPGNVVMSSGPGMMSSGPGNPVMSSGPGMMRSSGPGVMSSGPGAMRSSGPGGPVLSAGPGAAWARQKAEEDLQPAPAMPTTTPDGRAIVHQGPPCAQCGEMIIGQVVTALGKTYHPEHFVCYHCVQPFVDGKYLINDNQPYCAKDFHDLFSPRCKTCGDIIVDKCINAGGQYFHPNHFCCCTCGTNLKGLKYKIDEESKDIYCLTCMSSRVKKIDPVARVCSICKRPIIGEYINLRGQFMHPEHMRCEECGCELTGGNCHEFEGALYCLEHYQQLLRKTCAHCNKPILGRSVTALGRVWHPEHFMCEVCKEPFMGSSYYEKDGKGYCDVHFNSLFGHMCDKCGEPIYKNGIDFLDKHYHPEHFMCMVCDKLLTRSNLTEWESKPMCSDCYLKLPGEVRKKFETRKKRERDAQKKRDKDAEKVKKESLKQSKAAK